MALCKIGEERTDRWYWSMSLPMRGYIRISSALVAFLYAGCLGSLFRLPFPCQVALGIVVGLFFLFYRVLFPNGISKFADQIMDNISNAGKELNEGNYDGVPKFLQDALPYPTKEELKKSKEQARLRAERKEQKRNAKKTQTQNILKDAQAQAEKIAEDMQNPER